MKKGLLVSLICLSSIVFSSCGRTHVNVTILECSHCYFENKTSAKVGEDFVIQSYIEDGYALDTDRDVIEIHAGGVLLDEPCFTFNAFNNKLTIYKRCVSFGDITIKATAFIPEKQ